MPDVVGRRGRGDHVRGGRRTSARSENNSDHSAEPRTLREEGELLLHKSRDVRFEVEAHPAYERILSELAPDEGRILRLLLLEGPQASVDVRTGGPLGLVRSRLIAPGLSMIGARAGCRYVDRVPSYLNNLFRLGMVWFSRETLRDHTRYQVLEAQPEVLEAIHSVRQAKMVRRSIHLTPFGEDFCRVCLAPDERELRELPRTPPRRPRRRVPRHRRTSGPNRRPSPARDLQRLGDPAAGAPQGRAVGRLDHLLEVEDPPLERAELGAAGDGEARDPGLAGPGGDLRDRLAGEALLIERALAGDDEPGREHPGVEADGVEHVGRARRRARPRGPPTGHRPGHRRRRSWRPRADRAGVGRPGGAGVA